VTPVLADAGPATVLAFAAHAVVVAQAASATVPAVAAHFVVLANALAPAVAALHRHRKKPWLSTSNGSGDRALQSGATDRRNKSRAQQRHLALSFFVDTNAGATALPARVMVAIVWAPHLVVGPRPGLLALPLPAHLAHGELGLPDNAPLQDAQATNTAAYPHGRAIWHAHASHRTGVHHHHLMPTIPIAGEMRVRVRRLLVSRRRSHWQPASNTGHFQTAPRLSLQKLTTSLQLLLPNLLQGLTNL